VKDAAGNITEVRCTYDPATKGGNAPDGRKVKATMHWVSAQHAKTTEVRLYNPLFNRPDPGADGDPVADLNPNSLEVITDAKLEPALSNVQVGQTIQFERLGYFCRDSESANVVFNRTVGLKDAYAKAQ
jgi:glutaminyl-tRNA synthetase